MGKHPYEVELRTTGVSQCIGELYQAFLQNGIANYQELDFELHQTSRYYVVTVGNHRPKLEYLLSLSRSVFTKRDESPDIQ